MDSRFVDTLSGRGLPLRGHDIDTRSHHPGTVPQVRQFRRSRKARVRRRPEAARRTREDPSILGSEVLGRRRPDCEREFRVRVVARARAAGHPAVGHSRASSENRFSEIFFGNSVALGMRGLTVSAHDAEALLSASRPPSGGSRAQRRIENTARR
jgi:hypothetical protein